MLEFRPIVIEDKEWIRSITKCETSRSADTSFCSMFLWSVGSERMVARSNDRLIIKLMGEKGPFFLFPFGCGNLVAVINELKEYCESIDKPLIIYGANSNHLPIIEKLFPDELKIVRERRFDDYVYSAEKLATLSGKALHSKRNHINSFENTYKDWRFEPICRKHIPLCLELLNKWREADPDHVEQDVFDEYRALKLALENFAELDLLGGVLWAGDEIVAFTLGEKLCDDTVVVHFEKARADIRGAYPMINREFVRHILKLYPETVYINREDDMGMENLRKAKESYKPVMMVEKYTAIWKK